MLNLLDEEDRPATAIRVRSSIQDSPIEIEPVVFDPGGRRPDADTVTIGIASFPPRRDNLRDCIDSLYRQADRICVYLNGYDEVPDFLKREKISAVLSRDYIDLNATGKVFFIDWARPGYFFTADDDFIYPENYIHRMRKRIDLYGKRCAVTVHGSIFPQRFDWYYERTAVFQYQSPLLSDRFVHLPGSGSFGVHTSALQATFTDFLPKVMVDLAFAILCKRQRVPIVSVVRPAMWLMNTERTGLYQQFNKVITHHTRYAVAEGPWSFREYACNVEEIVSTVLGPLTEQRMRNLRLDIDFLRACATGIAPMSWQELDDNDELKTYGHESEILFR